MVEHLHTAVVRITAPVQERRTRATWQRPLGLRRFLIQAEKTTGDSSGERALSFSTLDQFSATLCDRAWKLGFLVKVRYKHTRFFDHQLLSVELVKDSQASA